MAEVGKNLWPSLETAVKLYNAANIALIAALAIGVCATVIVVWMGNVKEDYLKEQLADTAERAAVANKAASQAQLALAQLKAPRSLTPLQESKIISATKVFKGTTFDMAASNRPEQIQLVEQLERILIAAGWVELNWNSGTYITRNGKPNIGMASDTGISIQFEAPMKSKLSSITSSLAATLCSEGIEARSEEMPIPQTTNHTSIHIIIGEKPMAP